MLYFTTLQPIVQIRSGLNLASFKTGGNKIEHKPSVSIVYTSARRQLISTENVTDVGILLHTASASFTRGCTSALIVPHLSNCTMDIINPT